MIRFVLALCAVLVLATFADAACGGAAGRGLFGLRREPAVAVVRTRTVVRAAPVVREVVVVPVAPARVGAQMPKCQCEVGNGKCNCPAMSK